MTRTLSIIIAHKIGREESTLEKTLTSILAEGIDSGDILIATEGDKSHSRNQAAAIAKGEILIFFDDDITVHQGCIKELLSPFDDDKVGIVGGVNIANRNISFKEQVGAALLASSITMFRSCARYTPKGDIRETDEAEILSAVMAIRKDVFFIAGGFPSNIIPCEENVLINNVQKKGYKVIYNPFAIVYHRRPKIFRQYFKTIFYYGKGRGIMIRNRKGNPKMLFRPSKKWLYYILATIGHYISYVAGMIWGLIRGK